MTSSCVDVICINNNHMCIRGRHFKGWGLSFDQCWDDVIITNFELSVQVSMPVWVYWNLLTHWGRVTHICVGKLTNIGSANGLSSERRQAIIWTNAGILLSGPLGTNFSEISIEIQTFSLKKIRLKMSSANCSFRLGLNVLKVVRLASIVPRLF